VPVGSLKNWIYGAALPFVGKRCAWSASDETEEILHRRHAVGAAIQRFEKGKLTQCHCVGYASLEGDKQPVSPDTVFRTASIAKMVTALLVMHMQTCGGISVKEELGDLLGFRVRNPHHPDAPVTLAMALSHTASIADSPAYFASFSQPEKLQTLLEDPAAWSGAVPGLQFRYSNLGAGLVGCALEKRFEMSFEALMQKELFAPLGVEATFDPSTLRGKTVADSYRVLPEGKMFDAERRVTSAAALTEPDVQRHYLLASGNLYLTAGALASLTLAVWKGDFLDDESRRQMQTPLLGWPDQTICMRHGMGLLTLEDEGICPHKLWGHQGFAYGAVNGVFFDAEGNGFVSLNSGASEQRVGHLALLNRDLIRLWMNGQERGFK